MKDNTKPENKAQYAGNARQHKRIGIFNRTKRMFAVKASKASRHCTVTMRLRSAASMAFRSLVLAQSSPIYVEPQPKRA
ncbi:MAG: hypothetical protein LBP74_00715 [Treponema sp.]|jgi:hypothetical protein|nr:hypothetical protein [Treponema sp.]